MSQAIHDLLCDCVAAGVGLAVAGDRLRVQWTASEDAAIRALLRAHKADLLVVLAHPPTRPGDPRWAVALLADAGRWRSWMLAVERELGPGVKPDDPIGWRCYCEVTGIGSRPRP